MYGNKLFFQIKRKVDEYSVCKTFLNILIFNMFKTSYKNIKNTGI